MMLLARLGRVSSSSFALRLGLCTIRRRVSNWNGETEGVESRRMSLCVRNSLTRQMDPFHPRQGNLVTWYACGPTVYDNAHVGHARCYVAFDIIRRILEHHFGYHVYQVMGVTDIDDKIISRAMETRYPYQEVAAQYEKSFMEDMQALGVHPPTAITRVSTSLSEIVRFIQRIENKGFAYVGKDGVYFSVRKWGPRYGQLVPCPSAGDPPEDCPSRDERDFALWKFAKPGEPHWPSPWGDGRPGWHIECSAMTEMMFGTQLDLHTGGIDLKFPHHENEIAQCRACYDQKDWVSYFLHTGHLRVHGLKMSKSLKNFITVKEFLEHHTAQQFRLFCLMHRYDSPVEYSTDRVLDAIAIEKRLIEFVRRMRIPPATSRIRPWRSEEFALHDQMRSTQRRVDASLADNFDTPSVMHALLDLVLRTHSYLESTHTVSQTLLDSITQYIVQTTGQLGLDLDPPPHTWATPDPVNSVMEVLGRFRSEVRTVAHTTDHVDSGTLFRLCDEMRTHLRGACGVHLEDRPDGTCTWKTVNSQELERRSPADRVVHTQPQGSVDPSIPPELMFRHRTDLFSAFDETGLPTHNGAGHPLSKSRIKKLQREMDKQTHKHDMWKRAVVEQEHVRK